MNRLFPAVIAAAMLVLPSAPASADWREGDGHKMHYPQVPDPNGWDVEISSDTNQHECADDWMCSSTGRVTDFHFWYSVNNDADTRIDYVTVSIYSDDRITAEYSQPGDELWSTTFSHFEVIKNYGGGHQGFVDPQQPETWGTGADNHVWYHQINITNVEEPFYQEEGTIYWLGLYVGWEGGAQDPVGWKTSLSSFGDAAVFRNDTEGDWIPLDPALTQYVPERFDFAFVITPEPSTFVLLGMAGISVLFFGWRKRRAG